MLRDFQWTCPRCHEPQIRPIDSQTSAKLIAAQAPLRYIPVPAEAREPRPAGPMSLDDLIDLHNRLEGIA